MAKKVTMQQIAVQAGVSKYAVSKALSGQSGVSEETREKIVKIATQLGYFLQEKTYAGPRTPIIHGQRRANTIIVLLPNVRMQNRASSFWGRIVDGVTSAVAERGLGTILVTEHSPDNFLSVLNPAGVLGIVGVGLVGTSLLLEVRKFGMPFVLIDHEDESVPSDTVFFNNYDSSRQLTSYLIGQGHHSLQFIGDQGYSESFRQRWLGFRTSVEDHGIPVRQRTDLLSSLGASREEHVAHLSRIIRQMVHDNELPGAFVCANDSIAISLLTALQHSEIRVPDDVSVTGFDDIDDALDVTPTLTTVHVDKRQMGARAVDLLIRRVDNMDAPREKLLVCGHVVLRNSAAAAVR